MREILFKGFHENENGSTVITINGEKKRGVWVYGSYVFYEHCPQHSIYINEDVGGNGYDEPKYMLRQIEVLPETVCEYTGLTDKNGERIFENDICEYFYNGKWYIDVVTFSPPIFTYKNAFRLSLYQDMIIGNIFENPELLEAKTE